MIVAERIAASGDGARDRDKKASQGCEAFTWTIFAGCPWLGNSFVSQSTQPLGIEENWSNPKRPCQHLRLVWCGPAFPAVLRVEHEGIFSSLQPGFHRLLMFQRVEIFQEQQPRGLLGVVQLGGAARFLPEGVVDILEGLFEHGYPG